MALASLSRRRHIVVTYCCRAVAVLTRARPASTQLDRLDMRTVQTRGELLTTAVDAGVLLKDIHVYVVVAAVAATAAAGSRASCVSPVERAAQHIQNSGAPRRAWPHAAAQLLLICFS